MRIQKAAVVVVVVLCSAFLVFADGKPKLTLDEFFNSVSFSAVEISPDGNSVVIGTERADWDQQIFRNDLWLYRDGGALMQLTQSGHDTTPKWSPDGRWIAFLSDRKTTSEKGGASDSDSDTKDKDEAVSQIYLISPGGGEAFAVTQGEEEVHTFSWSADSHTLYFATRNPWTKTQKDDYKKEWKDVLQYRTAERGDTIFALDLESALTRHMTAAAKEESEKEKESDLTPGTRAIAKPPLRVEDTAALSQRARQGWDTWPRLRHAHGHLLHQPRRTRPHPSRRAKLERAQKLLPHLIHQQKPRGHKAH